MRRASSAYLKQKGRNNDMTLEEVWSSLTILSDNTVINTVLGGVLFGAIIMVGFIVLAVKDYACFPRSMCVLFAVWGVLFSGMSLFFYLECPMQITLQVEVKTETVSAEQLSKYFELSDVSIGDGKIICSIEPRFVYFSDEDSYYDEVAELLKKGS